MQLKWPMLWDLFSLFPAHAGVILTADPSRTATLTFPRTRGGDPRLIHGAFKRLYFSPHTRG